LLVCSALYFTHVYLYRLSRILLVDDESDLMELYRDVLTGAGHEVDGFTDPLDAYSHFQEDTDRYDAIISDVMMLGDVRSSISKETKRDQRECTNFLYVCI
jgi:DNA-binding response OmpR family regulator